MPFVDNGVFLFVFLCFFMFFFSHAYSSMCVVCVGVNFCSLLLQACGVCVLLCEEGGRGGRGALALLFWC